MTDSKNSAFKNLLLLAFGGVVGVAASLLLSSSSPSPPQTFPKKKIHWKNKEGQTDRPVVSHTEWLQARRQLLSEEKNLLNHLDRITQLRQQLPWEKVAKDYVFDSEKGPISLQSFFQPEQGIRDLVVWHFMFPPSAEKACTWCSFWLDGFDNYAPNLRHFRKMAFVAIAKAPLEKVTAFVQRKGWKNFQVVSSYRNTFNSDFGVTRPEEEKKAGTAKFYNFGIGSPKLLEEYSGLSVFRLSEAGDEIYHTYGAFERGFDIQCAGHALCDLLPHGRDGFRPNKHKEDFPNQIHA